MQRNQEPHLPGSINFNFYYWYSTPVSHEVTTLGMETLLYSQVFYAIVKSSAYIILGCSGYVKTRWQAFSHHLLGALWIGILANTLSTKYILIYQINSISHSIKHASVYIKPSIIIMITCGFLWVLMVCCKELISKLINQWVSWLKNSLGRFFKLSVS